MLDGRTSDICISYSGQVFVNGKGPIPPLHQQYRSTTCPVFDILEAAGRVTIPTVTETRPDWKRELDFLAEAKRTGRSVKRIRRAWAKRVFGEVPSETTYAAWLKTQPTAFQNEVLGRMYPVGSYATTSRASRDLPRAERASFLLSEIEVSLPSRPSGDGFVDFGHCDITRLEPGKLWLASMMEGGEFGPIDVPVTATDLLEKGWTISCALVAPAWPVAPRGSRKRVSMMSGG